MSGIWAGMVEAFLLVWSLDADLIDITLRSLKVSLSALVIACAIALPLGTWLAIRRFRHRRFVIATLNALMGLPPVVVGLIVYLLLSRAGPFGVLDLLFTPTAMIIAQVIIITPLIASITHQAMRELWSEYHDLLISLNTTHGQRIATLIWDGRRTLMTAALAGFGRADWGGGGDYDCGRQYRSRHPSSYHGDCFGNGKGGFCAGPWAGSCPHCAKFMR